MCYFRCKFKINMVFKMAAKKKIIFYFYLEREMGLENVH